MARLEWDYALRCAVWSQWGGPAHAPRVHRRHGILVDIQSAIHSLELKQSTNCWNSNRKSADIYNSEAFGYQERRKDPT